MRAIHKPKNPRMMQIMLDIAHILICIAIVALTVLVFLKPAEYNIIYPIIFFLAALMSGLEALERLKLENRRRNRKTTGAACLTLTAVLLVLTVISAITVLRT